MFSFRRSPTVRQYLVILTANLNMVMIGMIISWASPMLVKLKDGNGTGLAGPITDEEGSWVVSIGIICSLPLLCTIGFIMDKIGRRTCLLLACIPRLAMSLLLLFASQVWVLLLARAINGTVTYSMIAVVSTYSSEIASKEIRGALGTTGQVASATGMLIFFGIAPFLPYFYVNLMYVCIVAAASIPMWFLPESPYYLYSQGRKEESLKVLTFLRGSKVLAHEEIKQYECQNESATKPSIKEIFSDFITLKTLCKVIIMSILLEFVGYSIILLYMMEILKSTHTSVSDNMASVVNGCLQLVACFCTAFLTDRFGRKPILITTLLGMSLGMVGLGTFFYLKQQHYEITGLLNLIPLLSLMLVNISFNAGLGSLIWIVTAELLDTPARAIGVSICTFMATLMVFLCSKYFPSIINAFGPAVTYWWVSINCIITGLFVMFFIPETKGKTFGEIQMELGRKMKGVEVIEDCTNK